MAGGKCCRNGRRLKNHQGWLQIPIIPIYYLSPNPVELGEPCTFVCAIASPTGTSSEQPPSSLPSGRLEIPLRSRSRLPTDSARGSDAVRAGISHSIWWNGRRHDGAWWCCPIAYRLHLGSKSRPPSGAVSRSSAPLSGTMEPWRLRETDADIESGNHAVLGTPPTHCQSRTDPPHSRSLRSARVRFSLQRHPMPFQTRIDGG